jgi:NADPH:quinone reductase-like Zn-dependent oxidoreductase
MRALLQPAYGSVEVLRLGTAPVPTPREGEVLVRVVAASVCRGDIHFLSGKPYVMRLAGIGIRRPKRLIPGQDMAGLVVAVGPGVSGFQPGDSVFGQALQGAFAEFVTLPAARVAHKPRGLSFAQAAAVPDSGVTALQALRDAGALSAGQSLLINGASGGVGSFAIQIGRLLGAKVTAVCHTRNAETARNLGAERVIDYSKEEFVQERDSYDLMLDLVGNRTISECRRVLKPRGIFVSSAGNPGGDWVRPIVRILGVVLQGAFSSRTMRPFMTRPNGKDLAQLGAWIESGRLVPHVAREFAWSEAIEAVRYVAEGHTQGKAVIHVHKEPETTPEIFSAKREAR